MDKIIFPCSFVTLNEYINAERANKQWAAKLKKQETRKSYFHSISSKGKILDKQYNLLFIWTQIDNRKDSDNIFFACKFILDGMVKAKVIKNDGFKQIKSIYHERVKGEKEQVEVYFLDSEFNLRGL